MDYMKYLCGVLLLVAVVVGALGVAGMGKGGGGTGGKGGKGGTGAVAPSAFYLDSSVTMAGVTKAAFTSKAQTAFKTTVATKMGGTAKDVKISSIADARRAGLKVDFKFYAKKPITALAKTGMTSFLKDTSSATGFLKKLIAKMAEVKITNFKPTGVVAVVKEQKKLMKVPTMTMMPTKSKGATRRATKDAQGADMTAPAGSTVFTHKVEVDTVIPGNVEESIKMPREILCYVSKARIDEVGAWAGQTKPPVPGNTEDDATAILSRYDPALCTGKALNQTTEWMLFQAWHEGPTAQPTAIKAYLWVYADQGKDTSPLEGGKPMLSAFTTFTFTAGGLSHVDLQFSLDQTASEGGRNMTSSGCAKITAGVKTDANGDSEFTEVTSLLDMSMIMEMKSPPISIKSVMKDAAVMKMESAAAGGAQTSQASAISMVKCADADIEKAMGGGQTCSSFEAQMAKQMGGNKKAAVLTFNADRGAIQTASATASLGINNGSAAPTFCIDRKAKGKQYVQSYSAYDAATGELWDTPGVEMHGHIQMYQNFPIFNDTKTDENGKPWGSLDYPSYSYDSATGRYTKDSPQPVAKIGCHETGEWCSMNPSEGKDFNGDSQPDGWFGKNTVPDLWTTQKGSDKVVIRPQRILNVKDNIDVGVCQADTTLTLKNMATQPESLTCSVTFPNAKGVPPTMPAFVTFDNGLRVK